MPRYYAKQDETRRRSKNVMPPPYQPEIRQRGLEFSDIGRAALSFLPGTSAPMGQMGGEPPATSGDLALDIGLGALGGVKMLRHVMDIPGELKWFKKIFDSPKKTEKLKEIDPDIKLEGGTLYYTKDKLPALQAEGKKMGAPKSFQDKGGSSSLGAKHTRSVAEDDRIIQSYVGDSADRDIPIKAGGTKSSAIGGQVASGINRYPEIATTRAKGKIKESKEASEKYKQGGRTQEETTGELANRAYLAWLKKNRPDFYEDLINDRKRLVDLKAHLGTEFQRIGPRRGVEARGTGNLRHPAGRPSNDPELAKAEEISQRMGGVTQRIDRYESPRSELPSRGSSAERGVQGQWPSSASPSPDGPRNLQSQESQPIDDMFPSSEGPRNLRRDRSGAARSERLSLRNEVRRGQELADAGDSQALEEFLRVENSPSLSEEMRETLRARLQRGGGPGDISGRNP